MENLVEISKKALDTLKAEGADKAKCDVGYSVTHEFNVDGGTFSLFRTLFDKHLVLTAIKDAKKGTVRINSYEDDAVKTAAKDCLTTANSSLADEAWDIAPLSENKALTYGAVAPDLEKLFFRCSELMTYIKENHPLVLMEQIIVSHKEISSVHANTNGVLFSEHCGYYSVSLMFSGHEGDASSSFFGSGFIAEDLDSPFCEMASVKKDLLDIEKQIYTETVDDKFVGTMILTPACFNEYISYALDNFVSESSLLEGTSPWKDMLGKQVADPAITVSACPLDVRVVCGEMVTSDGFPAKNYDIIKNGVLNSFMISLYVSNKLGIKRAPNLSQNIIVANGDKSIDEILASVKKGIIVSRFSGGRPSSNGDFSGVAKNSFLVEDGKITKALSETMISGNLADMLNSLVAISKETVCDGMTVMPYAAFFGITVSGK